MWLLIHPVPPTSLSSLLRRSISIIILSPCLFILFLGLFIMLLLMHPIIPTSSSAHHHYPYHQPSPEEHLEEIQRFRGSEVQSSEVQSVEEVQRS
jgi:hypothetical protein